MRPTIHVIATTIEGTQAALSAAGRLAADDSIVLIVPSRPAGFLQKTKSAIQQYQRIARELDQAIQIRVCLCTTPVQAAEWLIPRNAKVVVGGRVRWWWPTREEHIVARLRRFGRDVVSPSCHRARLLYMSEMIARF